ncbi:cofactor-independent phosphoglycerate mutase [Candidatus Marinamargulisbacteria bacterium SCGC AG-333-B06]|nr:cofactor-independent phosphoglycerate mutase [Candidatus Marinamargulisbacteria bacterium SCGC AG-333-B06]
MTKHIICLGDGMADHPIAKLGNQTPLEFAKTPHIDFISHHGCLGLVDTVPKGFNPGSDVANMGILGFNPAQYYTGRGPIEAASLKVTCNDDDLIFRCNLVTLENNVMTDFTAGHITSDESKVLIQELNEGFSDSPIRFIAGVSYRHIMIAPSSFFDLTTVAPHDIIDNDVATFWPQGKNMDDFKAIIDKANHILSQSSINQSRSHAQQKIANSIWPWSQGTYPKMESFFTKYHKTGGIVTAVDLLKGLGCLIGLETPSVPGATGFIDTNYDNKISAAKTILDSHDFCYIHIEAPDEAGHMGDVELKIKAIEDFDSFVVKPMLDYMDTYPDCVIMVLPDHPTPCDIKTHTHEPVPFCFYYPSYANGSLLPYSEKAAESTHVHFSTPWDLLASFLQESPHLVT